MKHSRQTAARGFTLIEVMVSLGVFTFAITVIVASMGTSGAYAANDAKRTLAVDLLHNCFLDLEFTKVGGSKPSPTQKIAPISWESSPPKIQLWFTADGKRVASLNEAFYRCDIVPTKDSAAPLGHLQGRIVWPAKREKGSPDGTVELFTSLLLP